MPLIRKSAGKDLHFSVSPWNLKQPTSRADATQAYQETSLPFKPDQPLDPSAATDNRPDTKKNVRQHVSAGPWQARKKPALSDRTRQHRLIQNNTQESSQEQNSDTSENDELSSQTGSLGIVLQGTAVLAFLPTGQLSGHFIDEPSKQCFGIMGVQLTAFRECTRDTEWKLLKVTVLDFSSKAEDVFAAERTAADAARLQAPLQFHGDEPELAEALNGLAPSNIELRFDCHTILDGHAADAFLRSFNPKLVGQGAVVNKGDIYLKGLQLRPRQRTVPQGSPAQSCQQSIATSAAYDSDFDN